VRTIADSLAPPFALPFSYGLCRANVDDIVLVDDDQIRAAMALLFRDMKLAVEPAAAAATAALVGPLRERWRARGSASSSAARTSISTASSATSARPRRRRRRDPPHPDPNSVRAEPVLRYGISTSLNAYSA
jgi:threonine dehydratase